ncbi:MAG: tetratricopeptide repeat protein [Gammaproteobacteria bacterium]|nr:tetratricopeptide repeat protein [Gammaproteobacteria bacterium]
MYILIRKYLFFVLLAVLAVSVSGQALAQVSECGKKRDKQQGTLDEATWKRLNDVYEDVGEEKYDIAYEKLQKMAQRKSGGYQKAVIAQAIAQVEWARSNYDQALNYFEQAVALDSLPDLTHFSLMYQIAQLYYMQDRYDDALDKLELWMCRVPEEKVTDIAYVLKASLHAAKEDWKNVLIAIDQAISRSDDPKEPWYQMKLAAHFELEQFPKAAQTLETMIQKWPDKKAYWIQLSQIYYKLKQSDEALSILALAYRRDMLDKQADLMYLSSLYSNADVPFKAAEVLQKGIEDEIVEVTKRNWTIIADAWYASEEMEKSLFAYEKAGQISEDGEIDLRRAYILVDMERWDEAAQAVNSALEKGGFSDRKTGDAYVLQGMSEFNLGNYSKASTAWGRASKYPRAKKSAQQWMNHMREERARKS